MYLHPLFQEWQLLFVRKSSEDLHVHHQVVPAMHPLSPAQTPLCIEFTGFAYVSMYACIYRGKGSDKKGRKVNELRRTNK